MIAAPWYLLSAGIVLAILGHILSRARNPPGSTYIDHRMSDEQIIESLPKSEGDVLSGAMMAIGYLLVLISIVWRICRIIF